MEMLIFWTVAIIFTIIVVVKLTKPTKTKKSEGRHGSGELPEKNKQQ